MMRTLAALLLLGATASAQELADNPVAAAARAIGRTGLSSSPAPASSPTTFKSDGSLRVVSAYARKVFDDAAQRKALEELLPRVIEGYEKTAAGLGHPTDASGALAFAVAVLYAAAREAELDDQAFLALIPRFQASLDLPAVRKATDAQKQEFYEWALCAAGMVISVAPLAESADAKAGIRKLAKGQIENLLGADADRLTLKGKEVVLKPAGGAVEGFTFAPPGGWAVEGAWHVRKKTEKTGTGDNFRTAFIRFPPSIEAGADMGAALRELWKLAVPAELAGRHSSMVYRRYIGDGLSAQFIHGAGLEQGRRSNSLFSVYLIDLGSRWQPVVVAQTYEDPGNAIQSIESMMAGFSYAETAGMAEEFLATLRCPAAKGRPLVSKDALVGDYSYGSSSNLQWENIYTGAQSMTVVSYGGTLNLKADGSYAYTFQGASGQVGALKFATDKDQGTWDLAGDLLVLTPAGTGQKERRYRVGGLTVFQDGVKVAVLLSRLDLAVNAVTGGDRSDWYSTKKR